MLTPADIVFLLDVDNTLLDNDRFGADLRARLERDFGPDECARYWSIYAALRDRLGYADYLGALQEFRGERAAEGALLEMSAFLLDYPFEQRLYPHALETVAHLCTLGEVAILSDGDIVFQPRKIRRSGVSDAVGGNVIIPVHKQHALAAMQQRFPARRYVMVDDKALVLAEMKRVLGDKLCTVFVRQGHYAAQTDGASIDPPPDRSIERLGDLRACDQSYFAPFQQRVFPEEPS